jgi:hypothetical protein
LNPERVKNWFHTVCFFKRNVYRYAEVRTALGVGDRKWEMCSAKVYADMQADWMQNLVGLHKLISVYT